MSKELELQEAYLIDQNPSLRLIRTGYTNFKYKYQPINLKSALRSLNSIHTLRPKVDAKFHKIKTNRHYETTHKDKKEGQKNVPI